MEHAQNRKPRRQPTPPGVWRAAVIAATGLFAAALYGLVTSETPSGRVVATVVLCLDWLAYGWLMMIRPSRKARTT